jgi:hypothetical protein
MRKSLSLFEMYCVEPNGVKPQPISQLRQPSQMGSGAIAFAKRLPTPSAVLLLIVFLRLAAPDTAAAQCPPLDTAPRQISQAASVRPLSCRFDAALTRTFTPRTVAKDTYRVYVTQTGIDEVAAAFRAAAPAANARGAWTAQEMDPLDAFGEAGPYDRAKVARLYIGLRARVAHGPIVEGGRTLASITLVSPYPNASLSRLEPGTLIIDFRIPQNIGR